MKNAADSRLAAEIVIQNEKEEKCESIVFTNRFEAHTGTDQPEGGKGQSAANPAKTGDNTNIDLWSFLIAVSGMCAVILIIYLEILPMIKRRKVSKED